ncbi:hypothetical protein [Streptomyces sp. NBC_01789]|uniref:hypothetical protein n=1 Tax=Streptomyces sp. NBC_01789 TaxID=2975941 RepID=UPI00224DD83A|nr:hypothetical protein [Streptomyces sp. NBC_01789]MCX4450730.1 hypothetical protein [Streptomyces sp. NBC_01789]
MSIPWGDIATFGTAGLSAVAAAGAWFAAHRANRTADTVARIEKERWHADLTPQFKLDLAEVGNGQALLDVHLSGPDALGHLDSISIVVGNDDRDHVLLHSGPNVTQADVDAFVWGPFKFSPGTNGTDEHGRAPEPFPLSVGTGTQRAMQRTHQGHWMEGKTQGTWQGEYVGKPIRLKLTCRRGDEEWVITRHLENPLFEADA